VFEHGLRGASLSAAFRLSASSRETTYGVGALRGPLQFALPGPERVGAAIRSRPLQPIRPRCTLYPGPRVGGPGTAHLLPCVATPFSALDADPPRAVGLSTTLEEPSPKTIRPLTPIVASRHRLSAPVPTASFRRARLSGMRSRLYRESQDHPTVPSFARSHLPVTRRWRNDPRRLPSCQSPCELAHDPTGVAASRTRRLATPDRTRHHASSVTIRRDACAPFHSLRGFHPAELAERADARAPHHSARCNPSSGGDGPPPSASAVSTVCSGLGRPSTACLSARREARPRCVPTNFCFPLLRLRAPAPRRFPASLRSFRFALGRWACTQDQETGGPSVSRRSIRFGGPPGLVRGVLFHTLPTEPCL